MASTRDLIGSYSWNYSFAFVCNSINIQPVYLDNTTIWVFLMHCIRMVKTATTLGVGAIVSHEGDGMYRQMVVSYIGTYTYWANLGQAGTMQSKNFKTHSENQTVSMSIYPLLQCQWLSVENTWSKFTEDPDLSSSCVFFSIWGQLLKLWSSTNV